jgi:DNA-binding NarL/FixJ family response regulator
MCSIAPLSVSPRFEAMPISVALVEDHPDIRMGTSFILRSSKVASVVGEFERVEDLLDQFNEINPDVVLMDVHLPGISGIDATEFLKARYPNVEIVILSVLEDDENIFRALCAGASGYVTKPVMPNQHLEAVKQAFSGGTLMSPQIARKVLQMFKQNVPPLKADYNLSPRELEVLELLTQGANFKMIADTLFLSPFTICAHIRNIYDKLHGHTKAEAVAKILHERVLSSK